MNRTLRIGSLLLLSMLALALGPSGAAAQPSTETVSMQVDVTTPDGTSVIGTLVATRQCGSTTFTGATFTGMINGLPANASATFVEKWPGDSVGEVDQINVTNWEARVYKPIPIKLSITQTGPGLISVNGVPAAIDGDLKAPCGGRTSYLLTNPGQGPGEITFLPKTGSGWGLSNPLVIVALLTGPGVLLVLLSSLVRKLAGRSSISLEADRD